jgi:putative two-component system response regulator
MIIAPGEEAVRALAVTLRDSGVAHVETITDSRKALPVFRELKPDAVMIAADIDQLDVQSVMKQLSSRLPAEEFLPFIVLSPTIDLELQRRCLEAGLMPFFHDCTKAEGLKLLLQGLVLIRNKNTRLTEAVQVQIAEREGVQEEVAGHLAQLAEFKDHPMSGHTARVGHFSAMIALVLGMPKEQVEIMRLAAPLHDVGKVGIPEAILFKEEPLTLEEMDTIKTHTKLGASILSGSASPMFQMAEEIALYHHENWDGTGYTPGLEGEAVPLVGRIVRVVDTFDAITRARPFAEKWRHDAALKFMRDQTGRAFDPTVVEAFLEVQAEAQEYADDVSRGIL